VTCGQILSQDRHSTVSTALRKPKPQPNIAVTSSAVEGPHKSSGVAASPMMPNATSRSTATITSVIISSSPRAAMTSKVVTEGNCSNAPLLVIAWLIALLVCTNIRYGIRPVK
jgi:hypothetical protein